MAQDILDPGVSPHEQHIYIVKSHASHSAADVCVLMSVYFI